MPIFSSKQNQNLYLNGQFISGVQSVGFSYPSNIENSLSIQETGFNYFTSDQNEALIRLEYIPSDNDMILSFTGEAPISGSICYNNKYLNFCSGYLNKYSIRASLDNPVTCNAEFKVYGKFAEETGILTINPKNYSLDPYDICYTDITLNETQSNRLLTFNLDIFVDRIPQYNIGEYYASQVLTNYPIKIDFNFELDINEYLTNNLKSFLLQEQLRSIAIRFKKSSDLSTILSLNFNNIVEINESTNLNVTDNGTASLQFSTYIPS
jgi:hypothetical protein